MKRKGKEVNGKMKIEKIILIFAALALLVFSVRGVPSEPASPQRVSFISTSRMNTSNYMATMYAEAGNLTELSIYGMSQTQTWQGYYGEIRGTITLDDAYNYTMYDWYMAEPQGEIYAANSTVTNWNTARCFNYTNNGSSMAFTYDGGAKSDYTNIVLNLSELEAYMGLLPDDYDGVDETFNESGTLAFGTQGHKEFAVGTINISQGSCPATTTYQLACVNLTPVDEVDRHVVSSDFCNGTDYSPQRFRWEGARAVDNDFQEVMLTVNDSETFIFATIIENDEGDNDTEIYGFNNVTHDFQMLVLDDGHPGPGQDYATLYYFYVEIE